MRWYSVIVVSMQYVSVVSDHRQQSHRQTKTNEVLSRVEMSFHLKTGPEKKQCGLGKSKNYTHRRNCSLARQKREKTIPMCIIMDGGCAIANICSRFLSLQVAYIFCTCGKNHSQ